MRVLTPVRRFRPLVSQSFGVTLPDELLITGFSPSSGAAGTQVTIDGNHFASVITVSFNGAGAKFVRVSNTRIIATVPTFANSGPLRVASPEGNAGSSDDFTFIATPRPVVYPAHGWAMQIPATAGNGVALWNFGHHPHKQADELYGFHLHFDDYDREAEELTLSWPAVPGASGYRVNWCKGIRYGGYHAAAAINAGSRVAPVTTEQQTQLVDGLSVTLPDIAPGLWWLSAEPVLED